MGTMAHTKQTPRKPNVDSVVCNVKRINIQIVIERKKTVIRSIYFPASSHLIYCLQLCRKKITMIAL